MAGSFTEVVRTGAPPEPVLEAYGESRADRARHAAAIAFIRVLQGNLDSALAVFEELPEDLRTSKPARTGLASTRALLATLRGDDALAARHNEALGFKDPAIIPARMTAAVHEDLGTTTLASLVTPVSRWEYALRGIEQIAYEASKKKPRRKKKAVAGP